MSTVVRRIIPDHGRTQEHLADYAAVHGGPIPWANGDRRFRRVGPRTFCNATIESLDFEDVGWFAAYWDEMCPMCWRIMLRSGR